MVNPDSKFTLNNWVNELDMDCIPDFEMGFFGLIYFLGQMFSCLCFLRFADINGRKRIMQYFLVMELITYYLIVFILNQYSRYVLLFFNGMSMGIVTSVAYILALELLPEKF